MNASDATLEQQRQRIRLVAALTSLLVGAALMAAKFYAWRLTGSAAILSDALESIINVVASGFAICSVVMAGLPPDDNHPYGHGKIEFFSAGFEGSLIIVAAAGIVWTALPKLLVPEAIPKLDLGLLVIFGAAAVNLALGLTLIRTGKKTGSLTLVADGHHVMTDVYTSFGVVLGLILVRLTGLYWLDGLTALLMAANILVTGGKLVRQAFAGLMDASDPSLLDAICDLLEKHRSPCWIDIHHLRAWRSGTRVHTDFHLILPHDINLTQAHDEVKRIEALLNANFNGLADVFIHLDPCQDNECFACAKERCASRSKDTEIMHLWDRNSVVPNKRLALKPLR